MTLGIVGYGALGQGVARIAREFGMKVLVSARPGAKTVPDDRIGFDQLLAEADVISLHCPLNDDTRNLFGAREFEAMKRTAILINTARGKVVVEQDMVAALESGKVGGAALDVFAEEPPPADHPLLRMDNVICTPHIGYVTRDEYELQFTDIFDQIVAYAAGAPKNVVNPEVIDRRR